THHESSPPRRTNYRVSTVRRAGIALWGGGASVRGTSSIGRFDVRQFNALLLLGSTILGSAAVAAPAPAIPPILTGAPSPAAIKARCDWFVARSTVMRTALERAKGKASVATTLAAYDRLNELIGDGSGEAGFYREVSPSAASGE